MKIINLRQDSQEWIEWRSNGIGASDIGIIMKVHPIKSPLMLFNEMSGYSKSQYKNKAMQYGNDQEPLARKWLEDYLQVKLNNLCIEDDENSFMRASLDGIDLEKRVLIEIKSPYSESSLKTLEDGKITETYIHQVQWQLALCGLDKGYLAVWNGKEATLHEIQSDKKLQKEMRKEATKFWENFVRGIAPKPEDNDYLDLSEKNPEALDKVEAYKEALISKSSADKVIKELKPQIEAVGGEHNFILHGLKMTLCGGNTSYDFKAMEADGIDLSKYKKKGNPYHRASMLN